MGAPDLTLLYSTKDDEWKNDFSNQFENNAAEDILIAIEPLEQLTWPLAPDKKVYFTESHIVLVLFSQALLDFLEKHADHVLQIGRLLKPEKTIGILFGVGQNDVKHLHNADFSCEDWCLIHQEDLGEIIRTVQAVLEQPDKKGRNQQPNFKLVPRKVSEGRGKVYVILDQPLEEGQQLKVFFKETEKTEITVKKSNPYNWQFTVPDSYMRTSSVLKVSICFKEDRIGTQTLKCESRLCQLYHLLSASCGPAELMCDALGVNSYAALDRMLARAFKNRFPKTELCDLYVVEKEVCTQAKQEIPTLVHFAARYDLKHLAIEILQCPGAYSACIMKNIHGLTPAELAANFKHHDLSKTLQDLQNSKTAVMHNDNLYDCLPPAPLIASPEIPSQVDAVENFKFNNYDIPPSQAIPVPIAEYDYIDEHLPHASKDGHFLNACSMSPDNESTFLESQSKLVEINEAYKKGASVLEVMSMFNKWKSTYNVDSEAKSTLESLRSLYAQKNKSKPARKPSSSFKQLLKLKFRKKDSIDVQDAENNALSHEIQYNKYTKGQSDSKSHCNRLSGTFSTTSYTSMSSSSSSDRLSAASEHSDCYDYVTSFKNNSGIGLFATNLNQYSNTINPIDCKKNLTQLSRSSSTYGPQMESLTYNKKLVSACDGCSSQHGSVFSAKDGCHPNCEKWTECSVAIETYPVDSSQTEGYDLLPSRIPLVVQDPRTTSHFIRKDSIKQKTYSNCVSPCVTDYDIPKPPLEMCTNGAMSALPLQRNHSHRPTNTVNGLRNHKISTQGILTSLGHNNILNMKSTYENVCSKEILTRRNSIPDEIAPVPPILEEEEYYKYVGVSVPISSAK